MTSKQRVIDRACCIALLVSLSAAICHGDEPTESSPLPWKPPKRSDIPDGLPEELQSLLADTFSEDGLCRKNAATEIRRFAPHYPEVVPFLVPLLAGNGIACWEEAAWTIEAFGSKAVPALLEASTADAGGYRVSALTILGKIGDRQSVPTLMKALHDDQPMVVEAAVESLGKMQTVEATNELTDRLRGDNVKVARAAALALGEIGNSSVIEALTHTASDRNRHEDVRIAAIAALGDLGNAKAFSTLKTLVMTNRRHLREAALAALGKIGEPAAFDVISKYAWVQDENLRETAVYALGQLGDKRCVALLLDMLKREWPDPFFRERIVVALAKTGQKAAIARVIQEFERNSKWLDIRLSYLDALALSPKPQAYLRAVEVLQEDEPSFRYECARVLAEGVDHRTKDVLGYHAERYAVPALRDTRVVPPLIAVAKDPTEHAPTRKYARIALKKTGDPRALAFLKSTDTEKPGDQPEN